MKLKFPELNGGQEQGLNDAGVENFQGQIGRYVARECGQNTADASVKKGGKVILQFEMLTVPSPQIPALAEVRQSLKASLDKWKGDQKANAFLSRAIQETLKENIQVLRVGDYGTTGLTGGDTDSDGRWYALVKSQGVSQKDNVSGGSFGIGKSSPFAASRIRTVFYGTKPSRAMLRCKVSVVSSAIKMTRTA